MTRKEQFYARVTENVSAQLGEEVIVERHKVNKINVELEGLTFKTAGENIAPVIYLDSYFDDANNGRPIEDIVDNIIAVYKESTKNNPVAYFSLEDFQNFEAVKDSIVLKVINTERNQELLKNVPSITLEDLGLSVVFFLILLSGETSAGILVKKEHLELWDKDVSDLCSIAKQNTENILNFTIRTLDELISGALSQEECMELPPLPIYVLTDENATFGASQLYLKTKIRELASQHGCNVVILPSSVHELLLIPENECDFDSEYLKLMVKEVNATAVNEQDFLYDGVFKYVLDEDVVVRL